MKTLVSNKYCQYTTTVSDILANGVFDFDWVHSGFHLGDVRPVPKDNLHANSPSTKGFQLFQKLSCL